MSIFPAEFSLYPSTPSSAFCKAALTSHSWSHWALQRNQDLVDPYRQSIPVLPPFRPQQACMALSRHLRLQYLFPDRLWKVPHKYARRVAEKPLLHHILPFPNSSRLVSAGKFPKEVCSKCHPVRTQVSRHFQLRQNGLIRTAFIAARSCRSWCLRFWAASGQHTAYQHTSCQ